MKWYTFFLKKIKQSGYHTKFDLQKLTHQIYEAGFEHLSIDSIH